MTGKTYNYVWSFWCRKFLGIAGAIAVVGGAGLAVSRVRSQGAEAPPRRHVSLAFSSRHPQRLDPEVERQLEAAQRELRKCKELTDIVAHAEPTGAHTTLIRRFNSNKFEEETRRFLGRVVRGSLEEISPADFARAARIYREVLIDRMWELMEARLGDGKSTTEDPVLRGILRSWLQSRTHASWVAAQPYETDRNEAVGTVWAVVRSCGDLTKPLKQLRAHCELYQAWGETWARAMRQELGDGAQYEDKNEAIRHAIINVVQHLH